MDKVEGIGYTVSGATTLLTALQVREAFQIAQLVVAIAVGVMTLIYTIIKTVKLAKKDGVIDDTEKKEIINTAVKGSVSLWRKIKELFSKKSEGKDNPKDGNNPKD